MTQVKRPEWLIYEDIDYYDKDSADAYMDQIEQQNARLLEALQECVEALRLSYNVCDYPADGETIQDYALAKAKAAIASALGNDEGKDL